MAVDLLSIPAMSADPERLWSSAKLTVSDRRGRVTVRTLQAIKCLKSWLGVEIAIDDDVEDEDELGDKADDLGDVEATI